MAVADQRGHTVHGAQRLGEELKLICVLEVREELANFAEALRW
jgi:hypothetical protein